MRNMKKLLGIICLFVCPLIAQGQSIMQTYKKELNDNPYPSGGHPEKQKQMATASPNRAKLFDKEPHVEKFSAEIIH